MNIDDVEAAWNAQADEYNQWLDLDANEMVEFALKISASHDEELLAVSEKLCKIYSEGSWMLSKGKK